MASLWALKSIFRHFTVYFSSIVNWLIDPLPKDAQFSETLVGVGVLTICCTSFSSTLTISVLCLSNKGIQLYLLTWHHAYLLQQWFLIACFCLCLLTESWPRWVQTLTCEHCGRWECWDPSNWCQESPVSHSVNTSWYYILKQTLCCRQRGS